MNKKHPYDIFHTGQFTLGYGYMKSSTIRRSNLSKEKMAVLEALSKYKYDSFDNSPSVYVRPSRERELDMLWQNFKINQKQEKTPSIYLAAGFIVGAVVMLGLVVLVGFSANGLSALKEKSVTAPMAVSTKVKKEKFNLNFIPPANEKEEPTETNEVYTVQSGDTMESILVRFYGAYSKEKEALVMKTNNLTNPNKLSIGQKLTIPVEEKQEEL